MAARAQPQASAAGGAGGAGPQQTKRAAFVSPTRSPLGPLAHAQGDGTPAPGAAHRGFSATAVPTAPSQQVGSKRPREDDGAHDEAEGGAEGGGAEGPAILEGGADEAQQAPDNLPAPPADKDWMEEGDAHHALANLFYKDIDGVVRLRPMRDVYGVHAYGSDHLVTFAHNAGRGALQMLARMVQGCGGINHLMMIGGAESCGRQMRDILDGGLGVAFQDNLVNPCPKHSVGTIVFGITAATLNLAAKKGAAWLEDDGIADGNGSCSSMFAALLAANFQPIFDATGSAQFNETPISVLEGVPSACLRELIHTGVSIVDPDFDVCGADVESAIEEAEALVRGLYKGLGQDGSEALKWLIDAGAACRRVMLGESGVCVEARVRPQVRALQLHLAFMAPPEEAWACKIKSMFQPLPKGNLRCLLKRNDKLLQGAVDVNDQVAYSNLVCDENALLTRLSTAMAVKASVLCEEWSGGKLADLTATAAAKARHNDLVKFREWQGKTLSEALRNPADPSVVVARGGRTGLTTALSLATRMLADKLGKATMEKLNLSGLKHDKRPNGKNLQKFINAREGGAAWDTARRLFAALVSKCESALEGGGSPGLGDLNAALELLEVEPLPLSRYSVTVQTTALSLATRMLAGELGEATMDKLNLNGLKPGEPLNGSVLQKAINAREGGEAWDTARRLFEALVSNCESALLY